MNWIGITFLSAGFFAVISFVDKFVLEKKIKDHRGMTIYAAIVGLVIGSLLWLVTGRPLLSLIDAMIVIFTGMLTIWSMALYYMAIMDDDVSTVIVFFQVTPVMVLILSVVFLGETLSHWQLIGFVLVLASVISVSLSGNEGIFSFTRSLKLILIVDFMLAVSAVLIKFTINNNSFLGILCYESLGIGFGGACLYFGFSSVRSSFKKSYLLIGRNVFLILLLNEGFYVFAKGLMFYAFSIGPTALVSAVGSTQVFFGFFFGAVLTFFLPTIFKEDIRRKELFRKTIAACVMVFGIWLAHSR
ncbi:MAG: EamA family transporter [Parcubacteria group bacterium]|jgi:drug/metabolite transporter (DMT)-like permease